MEKSKSTFRSTLFIIGILLQLVGLVILVVANFLPKYDLVWAIFVAEVLGLFCFVNLIRNKDNKIQELAVQIQSNQDKIDDENLILAQKEEEAKKELLNQRISKMAKLVQDSDIKNIESTVTTSLSKELEAVQSAYYSSVIMDGKRMLKLAASFAFHVPDSQELIFEFGEGLCGQVAKDGRFVNMGDVPEGYITVLSGLGKSTPGHLVISPIKSDENVLGVLEIASFYKFGKNEEELIQNTCNELAKRLAI